MSWAERAVRRQLPAFTYVHHALSVPVRVNDAVDARFLLDTGIGLTTISKAFCERLGCVTSGEYRGRRMSGQELRIPLSRLRALRFGSMRTEDVQVGVFDMSGFPPAFDGIDGFLSLVYLERTPFTLDYGRGCLILETEASLAVRVARGATVPLRIDRDHATLQVYMSMDVSVGEPAWLEVDTGSDSLILDVRYMERLGIRPGDAGVRTVTGKDETQHEFVRHFARMKSPILPPTAPAMIVSGSPVMFEQIIYDGLVGHAYFQHFVVTYDLPRSRMILARE